MSASRSDSDAALHAAAPSSARPDTAAPLASRAELLGFVAVALQFALVAVLFTRFNLETTAFRHVLYAALAGFLVHHFLPLAWRLPFFLLLSAGTTIYVLGLEQGQWQPGVAASRAGPLFLIGLLLIGICHLPVRFGARIGLLILAAGLLAILRHDWPAWSGGEDVNWIWPVLGAIFMFRLMVYVYDVQHDKGPVKPVRSLAYFFMLPNVCFTLLPVVDYKTFCRAYYNEPALQLYQRGCDWMLRGVVHLLLWRVVYYEFFLDPSRVADGGDVASYMISNMALYFRVSGTFHIITGLLFFFGFNMPETHRRYFLASGFNDYWRRVNIYWKDFIMKLFYYPVAFRLRSWGPIWSVVAASMVAFFATWVLHAYQTFWVRNEFPIGKAQDILFWGILCLLVIVGSIREMKKGPARAPAAREPAWLANLRLGARTATTFLALSVLWSLWSADSLEQWLQLWKLVDGRTVLWVGAALTVIFVAAIAFEGRWGKEPARAIARTPQTAGYSWRHALLACALPGILLLGLSVQRFHQEFGPRVQPLLAALSETRPNKSDEENMVRGYYEDLMDVGRANPMLAEGSKAQPRTWGMLENTEAYREADDFRLYELAPSRRVVLNGHVHSTNQWGMRDQNYALAKSPGSYRIAILGSSTVLGLNVSDGEPFEALLEDRLNRNPARPGERYEVLNFGVNGYNPPIQAVVVEKQVLQFKPDALLLVVTPMDAYFTVQRFAKSLRRGIEPPDETLKRIAKDASVDGRTPERWAERRLQPHWPRMYEWAFGRIAAHCRDAGIKPIMVQLPGISESAAHRKDAEAAMALARKAGFAVIDLKNVFDGAAPDTIRVAPWDGHPNAVGHQMIATALYNAIAEGGNDLLGARKP